MSPRLPRFRSARARIRHPARLVPIIFLAAIAAGTALLMLPVSRAGAGGAPFVVSLFTATSAVCVTGLVVVDTPTYWSGFGQAMIMLLFQIGGFGFMTAATLLGLLVGRGLRLSDRLLTQVERNQLDTGDAANLLRMIFIVTVGVEATLAAFLMLRLHFGYGLPWGASAWSGGFHAVSAFNNAGFSIYSDSLIGFNGDALILLPIMAGIIVAALGFPVLRELAREYRTPSTWSLHTKVTVWGTLLLLTIGFVAVLTAEWGNPQTLGPMAVPRKVLNAAFQSVTPRTAGFNTIDIGAMRLETLLVTYVLMFVGGGAAGTAGGIKVTTFFLLGIVVWSEIRGERDAAIFGRRIPSHIERQALVIVLLSMGLIGTGTLTILSVTHFHFSDVLFETVSAFATVGLSTGITGRMPLTGELVLIVLMFVGRVGTITAATALALGTHRKAFRYPEERPIVG